jgi:uncharacterized membrane protein
MHILSYLFILLLALGATCSSDSNKREIPPQTETIDTSSEISANRQKNKNITAGQLQEAQPEAPDTLYLITGTEPFWSLTIARPRSVYTSADGDTLLFDFKEPRTASARQEKYLQVFELGNSQQLVLRKTSNCPCSDGMSDKAYPYQATLILAEKILEGCGRVKSGLYKRD